MTYRNAMLQSIAIGRVGVHRSAEAEEDGTSTIRTSSHLHGATCRGKVMAWSVRSLAACAVWLSTLALVVGIHVDTRCAHFNEVISMGWMAFQSATICKQPSQDYKWIPKGPHDHIKIHEIAPKNPSKMLPQDKFQLVERVTLLTLASQLNCLSTLGLGILDLGRGRQAHSGSSMWSWRKHELSSDFQLLS